MAAGGARAAVDNAGDRSGLVIAWAKAVEIGYYPRMIDALYSLSAISVLAERAVAALVPR